LNLTVQQRSIFVAPVVCGAMILVVTGWLYWPGIAGPAMLDDRASISVLDVLQESPEFARDFIFGDQAGPLGRPVSMLSFVLEKLYLDEGLAGSKKVNIVLHLVNGALVMWLFALLLAYIHAPAYRWLALLAGSAWLLSPLYVSTVLYVVQRMAMLATLFMLLTCISYVYWRATVARGNRGLVWLSLVFSCLVAAVFAKENAIVVVPVILLLECLWFQFTGPGGQPLKGLRNFTLGLIAAGGAFVFLFFALRFDWLVGSYIHRSFTLNQRVLTESRILWDYVGQLLYPDITRMGLYHDDVIVSRSLLEPLATLYASLAWVIVVAVSIVALKWRSGRCLVFGVLIFIIGHSTESTILALELYFEHRNYFPGIGVFLALAVMLAVPLRKWPELKNPVLAWGAVVVLMLAARTSSQVQIWSSTPLLYITHVNAHPQSFRANADMASLMASVGALPAALEYSARAHRVNSAERQGDYDVRDLALSCTVNQPLPRARIDTLGASEQQRPLSSVSTLNVLVRQLQDNECPEFDRVLFADRMVTLLLDDQFPDRASANIYAGLAVLENSLKRFDKANQYVDRFLAKSPGNIRGLLMKLHFSTALEKEEEAAVVLAQLRALQDAGQLTVKESQTLALYLEN
jgi:protein O-mannosyl-transferase